MTWLVQDDCTVAVVMEIHNNTICTENNAAAIASQRLAASLKADAKPCRRKLQHLFGESAGLRFMSMILTEKEMELEDCRIESEALLRRATLPTKQTVSHAV
ncbi:hypothetical protein BUE76_10520 [Cnuella takakiae]|nr:hypothetical protein BUE76_10520 [Cnuella takakiae]